MSKRILLINSALGFGSTGNYAIMDRYARLSAYETVDKELISYKFSLQME